MFWSLDSYTWRKRKKERTLVVTKMWHKSDGVFADIHMQRRKSLQSMNQFRHLKNRTKQKKLIQQTTRQKDFSNLNTGQSNKGLTCDLFYFVFVKCLNSCFLMWTDFLFPMPVSWFFFSVIFALTSFYRQSRGEGWDLLSVKVFISIMKLLLYRKYAIEENLSVRWKHKISNHCNSYT